MTRKNSRLHQRRWSGSYPGAMDLAAIDSGNPDVEVDDGAVAISASRTVA